MATWYGSSVAYTAVTQWAALTTLAVGAIRRQLAAPAVNSERCFRVSAITTGITGAAEPTWTLTKAGTTTDSGVTWTECTGNSAQNTAAAMSAPFARVTTALSFALTGDTVFFANNHAETQSTANITSGGLGSQTTPILMISIDSSGNYSAGASITTTTTRSITLNPQAADWWGWTINCGTGATTATISLGGTGMLYQRFVNCAINKLGTSSINSAINIGNDTAAGTVVFENTTVQFGNTSDTASSHFGTFIWRNTPSAIQGGTVPASLFAAAAVGVHQYSGVDFSALTTSLFISGGSAVVSMVDCKMAAGVPIASSGSSAGSGQIGSVATGSGAAEYNQTFLDRCGLLVTDTTLVRTGGASDAVTPFSHRMLTLNFANWSIPASGLPFVYWNTTIGASVTLTVYGILSAAALPNNDGVWIEGAYLGTAGSTLASSITTTKANITAANAAVTASTQAWDSQITARQNTHAYSLGDFIKVATNPGRVFICTNAGTSAGSEPGGYATAVDGGSVTDNGATFRAMMRFQLAVTITPQVIGPIYITPKFATPTTTFYIDPGMVVS